ncbi:MAG TPA: HIT domain-containing protein [Actinomycetes bacterium]|nr:HIT domain-containing protein [Actinomycetes bacterium]
MSDPAEGMQRLWAPDRLAYVQGENRPDSDESDVCPFCRAPDEPEATSLVVARGQEVYVVLNLYPYNPGHAMVCTYRHVAEYVELTSAETHELADLTQQTIVALKQAFAPHGFNVGMNQGTIGGAGIAAHLHQHVVPRWGGDTNFMPVVANTKVIPQSLPDTRDALREAWPN